jgi:hypothetical protein
MHGWTSQPWRPIVVFMLKGARRCMNIPAKAGMTFPLAIQQNFLD